MQPDPTSLMNTFTPPPGLPAPRDLPNNAAVLSTCTSSPAQRSWADIVRREAPLREISGAKTLLAERTPKLDCTVTDDDVSTCMPTTEGEADSDAETQSSSHSAVRSHTLDPTAAEFVPSCLSTSALQFPTGSVWRKPLHQSKTPLRSTAKLFVPLTIADPVLSPPPGLGLILRAEAPIFVPMTFARSISQKINTDPEFHRDSV